MGLWQLNAFVAWCKHAVDCMKALQGNEKELYPSSGEENKRSEATGETGSTMANLRQVFISWCRCVSQSMRELFRREGRYGTQNGNEAEPNRAAFVNLRGNDVDVAEEYVSVFPVRNEGTTDADGNSNGDMNEYVVEGTAGGTEGGTESNPRSSVSRRRICGLNGAADE